MRNCRARGLPPWTGQESVIVITRSISRAVCRDWSTSSRVVLKNASTHVRNMENNRSPGRRRESVSRYRESSRPILFRVFKGKKNQRIESGRSFGRDEILERKQHISIRRRDAEGRLRGRRRVFPRDSLVAFVYFRVMPAVVILGKTKESYSTVCGRRILCRVAEEISSLGEEKRKITQQRNKEAAVEEAKMGKREDGSRDL